eukprot:scaffold5627_cov158-Amphora_coffeaeformis.AAC.6
MQAPANQGPAWLNAEQQQQQQLPNPNVAPEDHEAALFSNSTYSTLNEPVAETIMRDIRAVVEKLKIVLKPMDRNITPFSYDTVASSEAAADGSGNTQTTAQFQLPDQNAMPDAELSENDRNVIRRLKDWDLWGPLILCLGLSVILSFKAPTDQASTVFAAVFCSVWAGGTMRNINGVINAVCQKGSAGQTPNLAPPPRVTHPYSERAIVCRRLLLKIDWVFRLFLFLFLVILSV